MCRCCSGKHRRWTIGARPRTEARCRAIATLVLRGLHRCVGKVATGVMLLGSPSRPRAATRFPPSGRCSCLSGGRCSRAADFSASEPNPVVLSPTDVSLPPGALRRRIGEFRLLHGKKSLYLELVSPNFSIFEWLKKLGCGHNRLSVSPAKQQWNCLQRFRMYQVRSSNKFHTWSSVRTKAGITRVYGEGGHIECPSEFARSSLSAPKVRAAEPLPEWLKCRYITFFVC